jgi:hypothetical protein
MLVRPQHQRPLHSWDLPQHLLLWLPPPPPSYQVLPVCGLGPSAVTDATSTAPSPSSAAALAHTLKLLTLVPDEHRGATSARALGGPWDPALDGGEHPER